MNKKAIIFGVVGALILSIIFFYVKAKNWIKKIDFGIAQGVSLQKIGVKKINLSVPLWFYNPSPFGIILSNLDLNIFIDGYAISTIKTPSNYMLAPKINSTYPLNISLSTGQLINLLADKGYIIDNPDWLKSVKITIVGNVTFDLGIIKMKNFPILIEDNLKSYIG